MIVGDSSAVRNSRGETIIGTGDERRPIVRIAVTMIGVRATAQSPRSSLSLSLAQYVAWVMVSVSDYTVGYVVKEARYVM